nr:cytochrome c oxidase subunit 2 [Xyloredo sp. E88]
MVTESMKLGFIDPFTIECMNLITYHDLTMVIAVGVMVLVTFFLLAFLFSAFFLKGYSCSNMTKNNKVEIIWTTSPGFVLCFLAYLSWVNLYVMEVGLGSDYHLKVVGRQWFWEYEYYMDSVLLDYLKGLSDLSVFSSLSDWLSAFGGGFNNILGASDSGEVNLSLTVESYLWSFLDQVYNDEGLMGVDLSYLPFGRMGSCGDIVYIPVGKATEVSISTGDVIHSWGVPALGVKMDAIPGRTNHVCVEPLSVGFVSGNCFELCGYGHSVMPINVGVVGENSFFNILKLSIGSGD